MSAPIGDFVTSTLSGGITATATTMTIGTGLHIPATGGILQLDYDSTEAVGAASGPETISYAAYTTGTGAITGMVRGQANTDNGTPGQGVTHANGATVSCGPSSLYYLDDGGWKDALETWAYLSATTITVPSGAASKYSVGDKLRMKQTAGTYVYFYVVAVADTVLTVTGGSDYTVANETITSNYYSKVSSPVGFPQWFAATAPTWDVAYFDNGSGGQPTTSEYRFCIEGRTVKIHYRGNGTKAGTNTNLIFATANLPVAPVNITANSYLGGCMVVGATAITATVTRVTTQTFIQLGADIADNQLLSHVTFWLNYEI